MKYNFIIIFQLIYFLIFHKICIILVTLKPDNCFNKPNFITKATMFSYGIIMSKALVLFFIEIIRRRIRMKLIGIDLDGTLLNSQQKISPTNVEALRRVSKVAIPFICSGRNATDIKRFINQYDLSLPVIGLNGAVGYDNDQKLFEFYFDSTKIESIYQTISIFPTKLYTNYGSFRPHGYEDQLIKTFKEIGSELSDTELAYELEYEQFVSSKSFNNLKEVTQIVDIKIYKLFVFIPNIKMRNRLKEILDASFSVETTGSSESNLEITPENVSKGATFQYLKHNYLLNDITKYAIGDSLNDLSLFENSDYSFAMANGHKTLKEMSTHIVNTNDNDGVAEALSIILSMHY